MIEWYDISEEEFDRDWKAFRIAIFGSPYGDVWERDRLFADPSWRIVPLPFTPTYSEPGDEASDNDDPYDPVQYPPVSPRFEYFYTPLFDLLAGRGKRPLVISPNSHCSYYTNASGTWHGPKVPGSEVPDSVILHPSVRVFQDITDGRNYMRRYGVFDQSGEWGLLCDDDELYASFLGGTPEFIEAFLDRAGGEENVRAWLVFWQFFSMFCPEEPETDPDDPARKTLEHMYDLAGWKYPRQWTLFEDEIADWPWILGWTDEKA